MSVLLRHGGSRFYYGGQSCWVDGPRQALDLGTIERAVDAGREQGFGGMEIVACFGEPDCELVLPLGFNRAGRGTATADPSEAVASPPRSLLFGEIRPLPNLSAPELS